MAWLKLLDTFSVPLPANSVCPLQWKQPFDVESATVAQSVHRVGRHTHLDALAVLDVYGRTVGIGQCQSVKQHGHLILSREVELTILALTAQGVDNLAGVLGGSRRLQKFHVRGFAVEIADVARNGVRNGYDSLCTVVGYGHGVSLSRVISTGSHAQEYSCQCQYKFVHQYSIFIKVPGHPWPCRQQRRRPHLPAPWQRPSLPQPCRQQRLQHPGRHPRQRHRQHRWLTTDCSR